MSMFLNWAEIDARLDGDVVMTGFEPEDKNSEIRILLFS
jgi:hypothetical protein